MQSMEDSVLVDHRTYRIKPGMTQAHLEIYEKHGFAIVGRKRFLVGDRWEHDYVLERRLS